MLKRSSHFANSVAIEQIAVRRELFFSQARKLLTEKLFNPDGSGRTPEFNPPWRETLWCLPALYTGNKEHMALANKVLGRYNSFGADQFSDHLKCLGLQETSGKQFGIFQSNTIAHLFHRFGELMDEAARETALWHCHALARTFDGSAQMDYNFHGANDNMPMMSTAGLILGGEAADIPSAVEHGVWKLHQLRRHLSRCAWMSEYNSSTYSPITLSCVAKIAEYSHNQETRELARMIEKRIWAELLIHYHPATFMQAGPHCRAYAIDNAGHNHSLQALFWLVFGPEATGRDILKSYFDPDGIEVIHFSGNYARSIAEYTDMFDSEFHVPDHLDTLTGKCRYPSRTVGRTEMMSAYSGSAASVHTTTFMEEDFSLGTSTLPLCEGSQTNQFYATYKRIPKPQSFRDTASVFCKYFTEEIAIGVHEKSVDGNFSGEVYQPSQGRVYAMQHDHVALFTATPRFGAEPIKSSSLKLCLLFPAHYGRITSSVIGNGQVTKGAAGESAQALPVSIEAGEVYIHIQPLLPTCLPRTAALRFSCSNSYEVLELINYEGEEREFSPAELSRILNGFVFTIVAKNTCESLTDFHARMSDCMVVDYLFAGRRFIEFRRNDVDFDLTQSVETFGVSTEAINGRPLERPWFATDRTDISVLPFVTGKVERNQPFFPWKKLDCVTFANEWLIGSRGLPEQENYSAPTAKTDQSFPSS